MAVSISVILYPFYFACLSQCLERHREDQHVPVQMLTPINREVLSSFALHSFCDLCVCFLSPLKGVHFAFCIVVASYGHVSLIVDQLDWQCCRSPLLHCCGVVVGSLVSRCEP